MRRWSCESQRESLRLMSTLLVELADPRLHVGRAVCLSRRWAGWMTKLIPEASGIVKSRRYPGIFWVHNDSGNPPLLFAIRGDGRIVRQFRLAIPNIDWEDIAIDDQGHLYLGDIGNNTRALPVRAIYRIDEPDPSSHRGQADLCLRRDVLCLARGEPVRRGESVLRPWHRNPAGQVSRWSRSRAVRGAARASVAPVAAGPARSIGRLPGFTEPATGADLSADGTLLAVCSTAVTRVYRRDDRESPPWRLLAEVRYAALPIEGIAWDGRDLVLVAEGGGFYRLSEKTWRAASVPEATRLPSRPQSDRRSRRQSAGSEMMTEARDVVIVGGGVIGLSIAYALAREGIRPTVLDRRDLGREASWAGAGLIPPVAENRSRQPLVALRSWSAELYPRWSAALARRDRHRHRLSPHRRRRRRLDRSRGPRRCGPRPAAGGPRESPTSGSRPVTMRGSSRH